ncbi:MAG: hypothetical protein V4525_11085 [Pseudomonadota bacterium]
MVKHYLSHKEKQLIRKKNPIIFVTYASPCGQWKVEIHRKQKSGTWYVLFSRNRYLRYHNDPKSFSWGEWSWRGEYVSLELALDRKNELEKEPKHNLQING